LHISAVKAAALQDGFLNIFEVKIIPVIENTMSIAWL
jgi:hypothetical protein